MCASSSTTGRLGPETCTSAASLLPSSAELRMVGHSLAGGLIAANGSTDSPEHPAGPKRTLIPSASTLFEHRFVEDILALRETEGSHWLDVTSSVQSRIDRMLAGSVKLYCEHHD